MLVDEGDVVKQGQVIARIDSEQVIIASQSAEGTLDANLNAAQAKLNQATTAVDLAAKEEVRYRELLKADAISVSLYDNYKSRPNDALAAQAAA